MIAIIDVTGNNLGSLTNAIKKLGYSYQLTHKADDLVKASHIILPGVGAADVAMKTLKQYSLAEVLSALSQPLLGICLGMQLLMEYSEEGNTPCLNLIPGEVKRLQPQRGQPVPHMGWNNLQWVQSSPLCEGLTEQEYVYFVHSYALLASDYALAGCQYSQAFTAIVQHKNAYGMQFHPEKSAETGLKLLDNFLKLESIC